MAGGRLDGEPGGFEPTDELADVLPDVGKIARVEQSYAVTRSLQPAALLGPPCVPRLLRALPEEGLARDSW